MTSDKPSFSLDDSAQALYAQLAGAGLDTTRRLAPASEGRESALLSMLGEEEQRLDQHRQRLLEWICLLAEILNKGRLPSLAGQAVNKIPVLLEKTALFATLPGFDGRFAVLYRGSGVPGQQEGWESFDYEISAGPLLLDLEVTAAMEQRGGGDKSLSTQLLTACKSFSAMEINTLHLDCGLDRAADRADLGMAITALTAYFREVTNPQAPSIVRDEYGLPNPNLTLLAACNNLSAATIQKLVPQIQPMLFGPEARKELAGFATVFNAIFAFPTLCKQLKRPPIEVNNIQRLLPEYGDTAEEQARLRVSRLAIASYGQSQHQVAEAMASVSSDGYQSIYAEVMGKRLSIASDFLQHAASAASDPELQGQMVRNIENGLKLAPETLYDDIDLDGTALLVKTPQGKTLRFPLHQELAALLAFFKRRSASRKKMRDLMRTQVSFEEEDYRVIARNFGISEAEARHLIGLLLACFDQSGRFRRSSFEKSLDEFARHGGTVFDFLWYYLKELVVREDRVSFLNAIQHLIARLPRPEEALGVLLHDVFGQPGRIGFSDRNALLLANLLLRRYNKELGNHIELTPEEVLEVKEGLSPTMTAHARDFLDRERNNLFRKLRAIHEAIQSQVAGLTGTDAQTAPFHYLITLERELLVFLSLVGGEVARRLVRGLVKEYGNPDSVLYVANTLPEGYRPCLQLLQVALRGLRRFSGEDDLLLRQLIADRRHAFLTLDQGEEHQTLVQRVLGWASR
ncbi:MAG: hypothetical protein ACOY3Z_03845 [Thermodesulfobacteriota bacterium]